MEPPVLGRASPAADTEPALRSTGDAAGSSWRADAGSSPWFVVRAASVSGVRHRLNGDVSEDWFAWRHAGPLIAVAVADGLGSVPGSAGASARAANAAVVAAVEAGVQAEAGVEAGAEAGRAEAVTAAFRAANQAAATGGATTLVLAVIDDDGHVDLGRVGDSAAFVVTASGSWFEPFPSEDDDDIGTETDALPSEDLRLERASLHLDVGAVLVLASDGVADPWRDGPTTVAPALTEMLIGRPGALELARVIDFSRQGCHDDRTLVCLWRPG